MSNAVSLFSQMPKTKEDLKSFFEVMKNEVLNGDADILRVSNQLNVIKKLIADYEKDTDIQSYLLSEVEKYGKGELPNVTIRETGVKYNYSEVGFLKYNEIVSEIEALEIKKKALEEEMKVKKETWVYTDMESGDTYEVNPVSKSSTTKVVFTLK